MFVNQLHLALSNNDNPQNTLPQLHLRHAPPSRQINCSVTQLDFYWLKVRIGRGLCTGVSYTVESSLCHVGDMCPPLKILG